MPQRDCDDKKNKMEDESKEKTSQPDDVSKMARAVEACATAKWETALTAIESLTALKPTLIIPHMLSLLLLARSQKAISSRLLTLIGDRLRFKQKEIFPSWNEEDRDGFCCGLLKVLQTSAMLTNKPEATRLVSTVIYGRLGKEVDDPSLTANLMHECAASRLPSLKLLCIELIRYESGLPLFGTKEPERVQHLVSFLGACIRDADSAVQLAALQKCKEYLQTNKVFRMDGKDVIKTEDNTAEGKEGVEYANWVMREVETRKQEQLWKVKFVPLLKCIVQVLLSSDTESESAHAALACVAKLAEVEPRSLELNLTPDDRSSLIDSCYKEIKAGVRKGKLVGPSDAMGIICLLAEERMLLSIPAKSFKLVVNSWMRYLAFFCEDVESPKQIDRYLRIGGRIFRTHFDSDRKDASMDMLLEWIDELRKDDDWRVRKSTNEGLTLAAGVVSCVNGAIAAIVNNIIPSLSDIDPRVASSAFAVMSQLMESPFRFVVSFLEHPDLISRLALYMRNETSMFASNILLMFINYLRELRTEKRSFTPAQVESIYAAIGIRLNLFSKTWEKHSQDDHLYQILLLIIFLPSVVDSIGEKEYGLMPPLKAIFRSLFKKETTPFSRSTQVIPRAKLLGTVLECITRIGGKTGKKVFAPDAAEIMDLLAPLLPSLDKNLLFSDDMDFLLSAICDVMEKGFIKYLPIVMDSVYPKERIASVFECSESAAYSVRFFAQELGSGFDSYKNTLEGIARD